MDKDFQGYIAKGEAQNGHRKTFQKDILEQKNRYNERDEHKKESDSSQKPGMREKNEPYMDNSTQELQETVDNKTGQQLKAQNINDKPEKAKDQVGDKHDLKLNIQSQDKEKSSGDGTGQEGGSTRMAKARKIVRNEKRRRSGLPKSKGKTMATKAQNTEPGKEKHEQENGSGNKDKSKMDIQSQDTEKNSGNKAKRSTKMANPRKIGRNEKSGSKGNARVKKVQNTEHEEDKDKQEKDESGDKDEPEIDSQSQDIQQGSGNGIGKEVRATNPAKIDRNGKSQRSGLLGDSKRNTRNTWIVYWNDELDKAKDKPENGTGNTKDQKLNYKRRKNTEKSSGKSTGKEVRSTKAVNSGQISTNTKGQRTGMPGSSKGKTWSMKTKNDEPEKDKQENKLGNKNRPKTNDGSQDRDKSSDNVTGKEEVRSTGATNPGKVDRYEKGRQSGLTNSSKQITRADKTLVNQWVTIHQKHCQNGNCSITNQTIPLLKTKIVDTHSLLLHAKRSAGKKIA